MKCPNCRKEMREGKDQKYLYCDHCRKKYPKPDDDSYIEGSSKKIKTSTKAGLFTVLVVILLLLLVDKSCFSGSADNKDGAAVTSLKSIEGSTLDQVMKQINQSGLKATYIRELNGTNITNEIGESGDDAMQQFTVDYISVKSNNNVDIFLVGNDDRKDIQSRKVLEGKLNPVNAWIALDDYCKEQYGSDIELHYLTGGQLLEEPVDENTWHLRTKCIAIIDGKKEPATCEASVSGSENNIEITDFKLE